MKTSILVAAIMSGALAAPFASAQDKSLSAPAVSAQKKSSPARQAMRVDMDMSQMQENVNTMRQQMEKLQATTDPQERQKLLQAHMQTMQESMQAMHGMCGPMLMGDGQSGGAKSGHKHTTRGDMTQRQEIMEKRMDMMQMMMEQMMQHEQAIQSMPAK